jgi:hypothetical protein
MKIVKPTKYEDFEATCHIKVGKRVFKYYA